jgi:hypothetical protein
MEGQLGADLSGVAIHTGADSAKAADGLGARAMTVGTDVYFGAGEFAPGTKEGDRLLAHELAHVVQGQRSGVTRKADEAEEETGPEVSQPDEPAEKEADQVADQVAGNLHDEGEQQRGSEKPEAGEEGEAGQKEEGEDKAGSAENAGQEKAPEVGAKLEGVGRKIFLAEDKNNGVEKQVAAIRRGETVRVATIEEARRILAAMPELKPATEDRKMPNPDKKMAEGFADPPGTYRGDLINKQNPTGPVHPGVGNPEHANNPHYNIKLPDGKKAAIIIKG